MNPEKIHPTLLDALNLTARGLDTEPAVAEDEFPIIVRFRPQAKRYMARSAGAEGMQVERRLTLIDAMAGTATRAEIERLSESDDVAIIWYDEPVYAFLDTSVPMINVPAVWAMGNEGQGVRICIVDTGIDADHPDLRGRVIAEQDFTGEGPGDGHGHGTHVASTAAGSGAASNGKYRGVAPRAEILAAKVLRANATGQMSFVMAGVEWAVQQGARVINLSLGSRGSCDGSDATSAVCDAAVDAGVVVCVAAGNEGPSSSTIGSPGCARKVITVGAVSDNDRVADFSSRGPTLDGRVKPDIVLPGVGIVAARAANTSSGMVVNEWYTLDQGTSMATPHATGVAALMLAANPYLAPADVKRIMLSAVRQLGVDENLQGKGRLIGAMAVEMARNEAPQRPLPDPSPTPEPTPEPSPPPEPGPPPGPSPEPEPSPIPPDGPAEPEPDREGCFGPVLRALGVTRK